MPGQGGAVVPFNAAAHPYVEKFSSKPGIVIGASAADVSPPNNNVQSYGYLRQILAYMYTTTAGTAGPGVYGTDGPWTFLQQLSLTDPNGAEIYGGPTFSGFDAYMAYKYGAYFNVNDLALSPNFSSSLTVPGVPYKIPLEMNSRSGLGALPNMDAQSPYKLKATVNSNTLGNANNIWSTATTTPPTVQFDYYIECWTVPDPVNRITGQPQAVAPVGLGPVGGLANGATVQHWTKSSPSVTASSQFTLGATRKGNIVRNIVLVCRNSSGVRQVTPTLSAVSSTSFPLALSYAWDGAPLLNGVAPLYLVEQFYLMQTGEAASTNVAIDAGVLQIGYDEPAGIAIQAVGGDFGWERFVGTVQSSRIEWSGTWGSAAGSVDILTNDVNFVDLTGSPYSFGFGEQLAAPAQPQIRT